jgi:hypothetical protein
MYLRDTVFKKIGGTIYGSEVGAPNANVAASPSGGHAVFFQGVGAKVRNTTAGPGTDGNLDSDTSPNWQ